MPTSVGAQEEDRPWAYQDANDLEGIHGDGPPPQDFKLVHGSVLGDAEDQSDSDAEQEQGGS
jgi:hypothetical protein